MRSAFGIFIVHHSPFTTHHSPLTMNSYKIALPVAAVCLIAFIVFNIINSACYAGPWLIAFFVCLSIGCRGYDALKGFSFTLLIFAAVTTALYYPKYFDTWGGLKLATLFTPLL